MKVTVVNGNARHGSTWHCMDLFRRELARYDEIEVTEFTLPHDMPHFCNGCFSCFTKGEHTCPHAGSIAPIVEAFEGADLIVLTSPVYGFDVSGQMKALLDHLCFMWLVHRPNTKLFNTVGLTVTTTAGAGLSHTAKTMRTSLKFWGVKRVFSYKKAVAAAKWDEIADKKQARIKKEIAGMASRIAKTVKSIDRLGSRPFRKIIFLYMKHMMKKNPWNPYDRDYWKSHGWLDERHPF